MASAARIGPSGWISLDVVMDAQATLHEAVGSIAIRRTLAIRWTRAILHPMDMTWTGYVAATLTTLAFLPQALKTLRTRDTRAISLGMYVVFTVGVVFWLVYGFVLESWPMILANTVTLVLSLAILSMKLAWR